MFYSKKTKENRMCNISVYNPIQSNTIHLLVGSLRQSVWLYLRQSEIFSMFSLDIRLIYRCQRAYP